MTDQYTEAVAKHYAGYRPPLHQRILKGVLADSGRYSQGLDVGCGTGRSSVALAAFCDHVFAVEPNASMLEAATPHSAVTYLQGSAESIPLADHSIDIATFAGSLFYADVRATAKELTRVCRPDALIVAYDFSILVEDVLRRLGITTSEGDATYDHRAGLIGVPGFVPVRCEQERVPLELETTDLAHVLLANSVQLDAFVRRYQTASPHSSLVQELGPISETATIEADLFYSTYRISGARP